MSLILNIDTSSSNASICLSAKDECLCLLSNAEQKNHAAWLHPAIQQAFVNTGKNIHDLKAVGITTGPGSYTGLRVGMATAKGLCYALKIPLIAVNTLVAMASVAVQEKTDYICPMLDARRMEVFTALYDKKLTPIMAPSSMVLEKNSFSDYLNTKTITFFGNGHEKFKAITEEKNAVFKSIIFNSAHLSVILYPKFVKSKFIDYTYLEPFYLKEVLAFLR